MNTFAKSQYPNVFFVKSQDKLQPGDVATVTTKYGKENECIIFNLHHTDKEGFNYYSYVREDGTNVQTRAAAKVEKYENASANASKRSNAAYEASQEGKDFLSLGEPIKVGHHSERRHRALIERNWNRMAKCVAEAEKAGDYESKAAYWRKMESTINLSMPESIEYYKQRAELAVKHHADMKAGNVAKSHSFSLTYAKKDANEMVKRYEIAKRLWEVTE